MSAEYPPRDELKARQERERLVSTGGMSTENVKTPTDERPRRRMSALAMRLANRLGVSPDDLVKEWPDDTLRRTKYPAVEEEQEDGSVLYKENPIR